MAIKNDISQLINHKFIDIIENEDIPLDILNYYPYGSLTTYDSWLTGTVNLKTIYKRRPSFSANDYALLIFDEVARAMRYCVLQDYEGFDHQRPIPFKLYKLFSQGIIDPIKKVDSNMNWVYKHKPIMKPANTLKQNQKPKLLYSKMQLAAISFLVDMSFENMC